MPDLRFSGGSLNKLMVDLPPIKVVKQLHMNARDIPQGYRYNTDYDQSNYTLKVSTLKVDQFIYWPVYQNANLEPMVFTPHPSK